MGLNDLILKKADEARLEFIDRCISFDKDRLENEVFPEGVAVVSDIPYDEAAGVNGLLDIYFPGQIRESFEEAFFLIHGGAFVYGSKELDKNFGMHLALSSGLPVININYTLMPGKDLSGICGEICTALSFLARGYGLARIHTTGDSAGGYLALITALLCNDKKMHEDLRLKTDPVVKCSSANLICAGFKRGRGDWSRVFMDPSGKCPDIIYDLAKATALSFERTSAIPLVNITGDMDSMLKECLYFQNACDKNDISCSFYNAESTEDRPKYHVFPIAHPEWPESQKVIGMFVSNAKG